MNSGLARIGYLGPTWTRSPNFLPWARFRVVLPRVTPRIALALAGLIVLYAHSAHAACAPPSGGGITVCSPANVSSNVNPVHYIAAASTTTCSAGISTMSIFSAAGVKVYSVGGSKLDTFLPLRPGMYNTIIQETDKCGGSAQTSVSITVRGTAVLTYQYNVQRTGANLFETILTPANVNTATFGKVFSCSVDSFIYGQPLFVPKMNIAGGTHNVVFVATENNSIYAFDADGKTCTPLWHTFIDRPVPCSTNSPVPGANCDLVFNTPGVGITSTMFIDPTQGSHGVIYVEARTAPSGVGAFFHGLHKLDLTTGKEMPDGPSVINASIAGNACDSVGGVVSFNSAAHNNRAALLYANGVVYIAFGSINDVPVCPNGAYHGWILGYNAFNIKQQVTVFNTSRNKSTNGSGAGGLGAIWGGALAASLSNIIFAVTANGPFDPTVGDWGNSYLKLQPSGSTLKVLDYFAPYKIFNNDDQDLGASTGIILSGIPGPYPHELIGGDKNGTIYVVNSDAMGKFNRSLDQIIQELPGGVGVHLSTSPTCGTNANDCDYSTPAYWNGHLYFSGVNDHVKEFTLSNGLLTGPMSQSSQTFGYPGATPTISANGTKNAIVWVVEPAKAVLHAYDATNLGNELYNSRQNSTRDALGSNVKFAPVTVVNGRVYIGTKTRIVGYGLLP
jgi:hypothetical protein